MWNTGLSAGLHILAVLVLVGVAIVIFATLSGFPVALFPCPVC